ncbi:unnamed protein product [Clavelina lepadiformis]|uniref:EF-hand domain-containing protein n=1 Tax=Clavelina lepadiformis TaxID=159417 RepID=A0ABP0GIV3_CLALP
MGLGCCKVTTSKMQNKVAKDLSRHTGLTVIELKSYYNDFMKDYPRGHISKQQFREVYQKFVPNANRTQERVEKVFKKFDQNNDGTIDFREFMFALSALSSGTLEQKLSLAFYLYDENGDGVLSFEEVLQIVEVMYAMDDSPRDKEGLPAAEVFAQRLFNELDVDKNGIITLEEFTSVGCKDSTIANLLLANVDERD